MSEHDPLLVQEYEKRIDKEIAAVEQDLNNGTNIGDWVQYKAKVKERAAFVRSKQIFRELINKARKGEG